MSTATELLRRALRWVTTTPDEQLELEIRKFLAAEPEAEPVMLEEYDAGLLGDYGGGNIEWWQDYIRAELGQAYEHYQSQILSHPPRPEPEDEPVAWIQPNHLDKAQFMPFLCRVEPKQRDDFVPLYIRPFPARKPMTEEEIMQAIDALGFFGRLRYFVEGVRFAEKHHGIGGSDA